MDGIHLLGEWFGCPETPAMIRADALRSVCRAAIGEAGLTAVAENFHQFAPQGVTGMVLLAESHLAIHTWPETGFVSVDVYVCNVKVDNTPKAQHLFEVLRRALQPAGVNERAIRRGGLGPVRQAA